MLMIGCCAGLSVFAVGCSVPGEVPSSVEAPAQIQMTPRGPVLAAPDGRTLYGWARDETTPGESKCGNERQTHWRYVTGQDVYLPHPDVRKTCEEKWPPFVAAKDDQPHGKWSIIERHDGSRQWVYNGRPMHLSIKDRKAGDVNGVNVKSYSYGGWQPAMAPLSMPPEIELLQLREGLVLATHDGRVLYARNSDQSLCTDCNDNPEPLPASALIDQVGEWSVINSSGQFRQYAFRNEAVFVAREAAAGPYPKRIEGWKPLFYQRAARIPDAIETRFSLIGDIYTDRNGMALYVFNCEAGPLSVPCDDPGDPAAHWSILCGTPEACAQRWRPYRAEADAEPAGEWSIMRVPYPVYTDPLGFTYAEDNNNPVVAVWAYRGRPVYTFADDNEPGQVLGHKITGLPGSGFYAIQAPGNPDTTLSR